MQKSHLEDFIDLYRLEICTRRPNPGVKKISIADGVNSFMIKLLPGKKPTFTSSGQRTKALQIWAKRRIRMFWQTKSLKK